MTGGLTFRRGQARPDPRPGRGAGRPGAVPAVADYVGDLAETTALIWPGRRASDRPAATSPHAPSLAEVVERSATTRKADLPAATLADWLDALDETGRWALLKLVTGELRVGVSARLAKTAVAQLGGIEADAVEEVWHGLEPPYETCSPGSRDAGPSPRPGTRRRSGRRCCRTRSRTSDFAKLDPDAFSAEWKWDGIRVQVVGGRAGDGRLGRPASIRAPARTSPAPSRTSPRPSPSRARSTASC